MDLKLAELRTSLISHLASKEILTEYKGVKHFPFNFVSVAVQGSGGFEIQEQLGLRYLELVPQNPDSSSFNAKCAIGRVFLVTDQTLEESNELGAELGVALSSEVYAWGIGCGVGIAEISKPRSMISLKQNEQIAGALKAVNPIESVYTEVGMRNPVSSFWYVEVVLGWDMAIAF